MNIFPKLQESSVNAQKISFHQKLYGRRVKTKRKLNTEIAAKNHKTYLNLSTKFARAT